MMTSQHWLEQTKRGVFTPRSKKLKVIDDALAAYELAQRSRQGTTPALTALFNALIDWIQKKGTGWKSSTRNSKTEPGGKGTVETLFNQVIALNPAFRVTAAQYLSQTAAPPPLLMQHGAKNRQKDEDGTWYEIPVQTQENSCGPCSIRMVIKLVQNKDVGEEYLRELVEGAEEGGAYGGTLGQSGVLATGGAHDWSPNGGGTWFVPAALDAVRPPINFTQSIDTSILLKTTKKKPAIGVVAWNDGGLHYVVAAGKNRSGTKLVILDPFNGVQSVPFAGNTLGNYQPIDPNSQSVLASATWHPWVCKIN